MGKIVKRKKKERAREISKKIYIRGRYTYSI